MKSDYARFAAHEQTVDFIRPDEVIYNRVRAEAPLIGETVTVAAKLSGLSEAAALGWCFDSQNLLYKHKPRSSGMGDPMVRELARRVREATGYAELHDAAAGDEISAALGSCSLVSEIAAGLPGEVKAKAERERKAREAAEAARAAYESACDAGLPDEKVTDFMEEKIEAEEVLRAAGVDLAEAMRNHGRTIAGVVAGAVINAKEKVTAVVAAAASFSFGTGIQDPTGGMSPAEKFKLAGMVAKAGPAFQQLLKILGRMVPEALQKLADRTRHEAGAIVDITLGNDIGSVLEDEFMLLMDPELEAIAMLRLATETAMQYEVENKETLGRGNVVILIDESGSMSGQREAEAKAVALALAHVCARQNRTLVVHFFQSAVTETITIEPGDATSRENGVNVALHKMGKMAARGTGGGTDFNAPLIQAIATAESGGLERPDVIMITDGVSEVSDVTVAAVKACQVRCGARFFSMLIGSGSVDELKKFSDNVWSADSLLKGPAARLFELI